MDTSSVNTVTMFSVAELTVNVDDEVEKYRQYAERMRPLVSNTISYIHKCLMEGKKVLVEGANATMLDIDFGEFVYSFLFTCRCFSDYGRISIFCL